MSTIKAIQVPPPGPPCHTDHFLDWMYRQQTSCLEPAPIKVPISGFLNFPRLERKQMLSYGIPPNGRYVGSVRGADSGPSWRATGKTLFFTQCGGVKDRTASFSGMQTAQRATEAHGSLVERCEVWYSCCVLGCTLQYHCVTNAPWRGSGYHFPGDPKTTADSWYSWMCTHWTQLVYKGYSAGIYWWSDAGWTDFKGAYFNATGSTFVQFAF